MSSFHILSFHDDQPQRYFKVSINPNAFAMQVIRKVLDNNGGSSIWKDTNTFVIWLLFAIRPQSAFDSIIKSGVGFDDENLIKKIYERGQQFAKQG